MSVLQEALSRANARKDCLWAGQTCHLDEHGVALMLSGCDLDPCDLAGYMDAASAAFLVQWASGEDLEQVVQGILVEGLLMGIMADRVYHERAARGYTKPPEPSIVEVATTLWNLVLGRLKDMR